MNRESINLKGKEIIEILIMIFVFITIIFAFIGFIMFIVAVFFVEYRLQYFELGTYLMVPFIFLVLLERLWAYRIELKEIE